MKCGLYVSLDLTIISRQEKDNSVDRMPFREAYAFGIVKQNEYELLVNIRRG